MISSLNGDCSRFMYERQGVDEVRLDKQNAFLVRKISLKKQECFDQAPNPDERDKCLSQIVFVLKKQENDLQGTKGRPVFFFGFLLIGAGLARIYPQNHRLLPVFRRPDA